MGNNIKLCVVVSGKRSITNTDPWTKDFFEPQMIPVMVSSLLNSSRLDNHFTIKKTIKNKVIKSKDKLIIVVLTISSNTSLINAAEKLL